MIGMLDHEMHIQGQTGFLSHHSDDIRSKRNVIDEVAVHNVAVNPIGACGFDPVDFLSKPREICRQNGWSYEHFVHEVME
jgi:hypothetical protein